MADEVRFWEGQAAGRDDAPQAGLKAVLLLLEEPEPAWASIDAMLHARADGADAWKRWQRCLTALHQRSAKAVAAMRKTAGLIPDDPANASMRADGWEPFHELAARLTRMWGPPAKVDEKPGQDGRPGQTRMEWARAHEGGRQAGQPVRCFVDAHPNNPGWQRIRWASWREGMRAPTKRDAVLGAAMGVDAGEVFGATGGGTT